MASITQTTTNVATQQLGELRLNGGPAADQPSSIPPKDYKYARFLPSYDQNLKLPPLESFEHVDPGHEALKHPNPRSFLDGGKITNLTPNFGSEVEGIQLSRLDKAGKR